MKKILFLLLVAASIARAGSFTENFATDPLTNGWQVFGNTNLFHWNSTNQNLEVTWDSSQSNSYFYHPLPLVLTKADDFTLGFDLTLTNFAIGTTPGAPSTFEIAVGLLNLASATNSTFLRGVFPFVIQDLVEFDFFPEDPVNGISATVGPTVFFSNMDFNFDGNTFPLSLTSNNVFRVQMQFTAATKSLITTVTRNGQPFGPVNSANLASSAADFQLAQLAVMSYSDAGQDPSFSGSVFAQGTMDNFSVTTPVIARLTGGFAGTAWQMQFISSTNWHYSLERTSDFQTWATVAPTNSGTGAVLTLQDTTPPTDQAFYRIHAAQ